MAQKGLGEVWVAPTTLHLAACRNVEPDIFFVRKGSQVQELEDCLSGVPDFVIEVTGRRRREYDLGEKLAEYKKAGVPEIWVIDRQRRQLHRFVKEKEQYKEETLTVGRVVSKAVKGFWVDVSWLWKEPLPNELWVIQQILAS